MLSLARIRRICCVYVPTIRVIQGPRNQGGIGGKCPTPNFFVPGEKVPFFGNESLPYFHGIEVPFLQNLNALFGQCPLTFGVLPRPLGSFDAHKRVFKSVSVMRAYSGGNSVSEVFAIVNLANPVC